MAATWTTGSPGKTARRCTRWLPAEPPWSAGPGDAWPGVRRAAAERSGAALIDIRPDSAVEIRQSDQTISSGSSECPFVRSRRSHRPLPCASPHRRTHVPFRRPRRDDGQPDLPGGGHASCPVAASSITWCDSGPLPAWTRNWTCSRPGERTCGGGVVSVVVASWSGLRMSGRPGRMSPGLRISSGMAGGLP
jgi:hypothetical protein